MYEIKVSASRSYSVFIGRGLREALGKHIRALGGVRTAVLVSDDNVFPLYGEKALEDLRRAGFRALSFVFPAGEKQKNLTTYGQLLQFLCQEHVNRNDLIAALGGGVTGDLAGFAAATYLRGVRYAQVPTSLLAMVDSSVGGKTAIDIPGGKNQAGCFCQPAFVLCDPDTLDTLPPEQYRCGCAEVIKYGLMARADFFHSLEAAPVPRQIEEALTACVTLKRDAVEADEFDRGQRRLLNLGHTIGHAIEACSDFTVPHGEAVAIGMARITRAAETLDFCAPGTYDQVERLLKQYALPIETSFSLDELYRAALGDKKAEDGLLHLVVPRAIGDCRVETVPQPQFRDWLRAGGVS